MHACKKKAHLFVGEVAHGDGVEGEARGAHPVALGLARLVLKRVDDCAGLRGEALLVVGEEAHDALEGQRAGMHPGGCEIR